MSVGLRRRTRNRAPPADVREATPDEVPDVQKVCAQLLAEVEAKEGRISAATTRIAELRARVGDLVRRQEVAAELLRQADELDERGAALRLEREGLVAEAEALEAKLGPIAEQENRIPQRRRELEAEIRRLAGGAGSFKELLPRSPSWTGSTRSRPLTRCVVNPY